MKHPKTHINQINKEQILKATREKQQITHKGIPIRITTDFSIETLQARREWQGILKVMKENNLQPRLLYPARISFKYEGDIKSFTDKQKLRQTTIHWLNGYKNKTLIYVVYKTLTSKQGTHTD